MRHETVHGNGSESVCKEIQVLYCYITCLVLRIKGYMRTFIGRVWSGANLVRGV